MDAEDWQNKVYDVIERFEIYSGNGKTIKRDGFGCKLIPHISSPLQFNAWLRRMRLVGAPL